MFKSSQIRAGGNISIITEARGKITDRLLREYLRIFGNCDIVHRERLNDILAQDFLAIHSLGWYLTNI